MPNVEFECTKCGSQFILKRTMVDPDSDVRCPKCGTKHPKRVLNTFKSKILAFISPGAQEGVSCSG